MDQIMPERPLVKIDLKALKAIVKLPRIIALGIIRFYQIVISPLKGPTCRFYPSCSQYCQEAIGRYGLLKGGVMGLHRILRCHPFHPGGYNPVE